MGHSRLVAVLLLCCFVNMSMSFRNSKLGTSILRSFSKQYVTPTLANSFLFQSNNVRSSTSQFSRMLMSTKTAADAVEAADDTTAEDLFGFDLPTNDNNQNLLRTRHTTAHIMAMAVQKLHPEAQVTIGPWIDQG